jgi:hypothetical protein
VKLMLDMAPSCALAASLACLHSYTILLRVVLPTTPVRVGSRSALWSPRMAIRRAAYRFPGTIFPRISVNKGGRAFNLPLDVRDPRAQHTIPRS